jgi:hypothetical protein
VNTSLAKAGGFGLRLKSGLVGYSADYTTSKSSSGSEVFIPDVFLPDLIGHIPVRHYPLAPSPEVPPPLTFANTLVLRQQLVPTFALLVLDYPEDGETRRDAF